MANETIIAVIVTHNPPDGLADRVKAVAAEIDKIIVIDNGSDSPIRQTLEQLQQQLPGKLECVWNGTNKGLAAALNSGINQALEAGADWVLLLDHDSKPQAGMIAKMRQAYNVWPAQNKIALIAPNIRDENVSRETFYLMPKGKFGFQRAILTKPVTNNALTVITSGSLVKASIFRSEGLMPEALFVDYIDHAFCLRLKKRGYDILLVKDAVLLHRLGAKTSHNFGGLTVIASNHSSLRRYYIFRNRLWLWKLYGRDFPGFFLHDLLASGYDIFRIVAYEDNKGQKLKSIAKGIGDGLRGSFKESS